MPAEIPTFTSSAERQQFWLHHIDTHAASQLSQAEYCRQHALNLSNFWQWKKKLRPETITQKNEKSEVLSFIPVQRALTNQDQITCKCPNGLELSWPVHTPVETITQLLLAVNS